MWAMQDALDSIAVEGQKQVECLVEIEDLFEAVKKPGARKVQEKQAEELGTCDTLVSASVEVAPLGKPVETAEKSTQASDVKEDVVNLGLLENRHCEYMLEAFHHLRFSLEIVSPVEIDRPERSQPIPESSSKH